MKFMTRLFFFWGYFYSCLIFTETTVLSPTGFFVCRFWEKSECLSHNAYVNHLELISRIFICQTYTSIMEFLL